MLNYHNDGKYRKLLTLHRVVQKKRPIFFLISISPRKFFWNSFHQIVAEWWEIIFFKSDWNWNLVSGLSIIVNNMFYPGTSLMDNCCNSNVEIVNNTSYHVSWYAPDLPSYVVLQIYQGLGIVAIDPFLEVPPEEEVTWVQGRGVGWPREVWTIEWCSIFLVDDYVHIYSPFPPRSRNELYPHECNVVVCVLRHPIFIAVLQELSPDDAISFDDTPHIHFLLAKKAMGMVMGLSLSPLAHILSGLGKLWKKWLENKKQNQIFSPKKLKMMKPLYKIDKTLLKNSTNFLLLLDQNWRKKSPTLKKNFKTFWHLIMKKCSLRN